MISYLDFSRVKHKFYFYILIFKCWKQFSLEKYLTSTKRQEQHYVRNTFSNHFGDLNEFDCWLKQHSGFWNTDDLERSILRWPDWIYYHIISLIACGLHSTYNFKWRQRWKFYVEMVLVPCACSDLINSVLCYSELSFWWNTIRIICPFLLLFWK